MIDRQVVDYSVKWRDTFGLVQDNTRKMTSGNGVLFTSEYVISLCFNSGIPIDERKRLIALFDSCQKEPGLLMRAPDNRMGYQSIDDMVGLITASLFMEYDFPRAFLRYGWKRLATENDLTDPNKEKVKRGALLLRALKWFFPGGVPYVYNNVSPGRFHLSSFMGRFPQLIAHAELASGIEPPLWRRMWWGASIIQSMFSPYQDGVALGWHLKLVGERKGGLFEKALSKVWKSVVRLRWKDMGQLRAFYFGKPDHPNVIYLKGVL